MLRDCAVRRPGRRPERSSWLRFVLACRHLSVTVMSVDAVQGRESDVAIFSVTRSNPRAELGFIGPDYWRRINVALSRARFGLTIVGDAGFIQGTTGALKKVLYVRRGPSGRLRA